MSSQSREYNGRSSNVEDRAYTKENSTPQDILAIKDCIYVFEPGILYWYETPVVTEFSVTLISEKIAELSGSMGKFVLLCDLTRTHRPGAEVRALLKKMLSQHTVAFMVAFTEKNLLINMAAKFVLSSVFGSNFTVLKEREDALEIARNALK